MLKMGKRKRGRKGKELKSKEMEISINTGRRVL